MADTTRASSPARPQSAGGGKTFLGQPTWLWIVGAGVVFVGYLYLKSHESQQGQKGQGQHGGGGGGGAGAGAATGWTTESFQRWTRQHHNHPRRGGK